MALVRGKVPESNPAAAEILQISSGVPCDLIRRYLKYRQQAWNNDRAEQTRAVLTSTINGISSFCLGSKLLADIPQERQTACDKLLTSCTVANTPAKVFELIDVLGERALQAGTSSLFFKLAHAIRSFYVDALRTQCPSIYQEEINKIKKEINQLHETILEQGMLGNHILALQETEFSLKLRLIHLEDLTTIIEQTPYLKSNFSFPITKQILPNGKVANKNYPFEFQKEFIESFYNETSFLKGEINVSYRSYIKNPSKYALKNTENMPGSDSDDDLEQDDDFDQSIGVEKNVDSSAHDQGKQEPTLPPDDNLSQKTLAAYKSSLKTSGSHLLAPTALSLDDDSFDPSLVPPLPVGPSRV